ncbi:LysR substrate-binding domain-containing protein [Kineosporia mesophila]|uniref:LysR substrate-binding domain-containing protein n=1 Tax=Kineosporia mesophila TaxID=566012 RepID=A0ABP6ZMF2_9ACTN|nr:LysR family transcriptional regulator [Kineosporia mesophila]MCD5353675.1 LysR family transcriptional regulator [Kineosporia mesophila]
MLNGPLTEIDLDLRLVRYFTVVAEHGHFGRAAQALYLPQSSLSRQIQRLEEHLGVRLIDRLPGGNRLTEAGEVFLHHAKRILDSANHALTETRVAGGRQSLLVGFGRHLIVTPAAQRVQAEHPRAEVHVTYLEWNEVHQALLTRRVDVAIARFPFPTDGLDITPLYADQRLLIVAKTHPLAHRKRVGLEDFADLPLVRYPDPVWDAFWRINPRPDGSRAPDGPLVEEIEEKLELVASGAAAAIAPEDGALRPDVAAIPIDGVEPSPVVLATRENDHTQLVQAFTTAALQLLAHRDF